MKQQLSKSKKRIRRVSAILIATVLSYVILSMAGSAVAFQLIFPRTATVHAFELTYDDVDSSRYPREEIAFPSGENLLRGVLYLPRGEPEGLVLVLGGMNSCLDRHLPEICYFVDCGFAAVALDNTGVGRSDGANTVGIAQARLDAAAAIEYIERQQRLRSLPLMLYGHSLGGYAAATVLEDEKDICAAVCVAGFDSPNGNMHYNAKKYVGVLADVQYPFMALQNRFLFGDKSDTSAVSAINASDKPVMIVGSDSDEIVPAQISILSRAGEITNPHAVCVEIKEQYRGAHSAAWLSADAAKYLAETENPTDKRRANALDEGFMQRVVAFYRSAVN